jgi:hypothetical protein
MRPFLSGKIILAIKMLGGERVSEKLIYLGNFGEKVETESDKYIKEAEMFSTGIHRGVEYNEEDIDQLVNEFNAKDDIPVQLDHSESARDTVGFLREAFSKDGKLMGKLEILDEDIQKKIDKGLMKKLSVSFYLKHTEEGFKPHKLREVSLVAFPQVKGARLFSENGYVSDYEETGGNGEMGEENNKQNQEQAPKFSEEQISDLIANYKKLEQQVQDLSGVQEQFTEAQVTRKIEKFQEENKVVPAQSEALTKLLGSFSEEQSQLFDEFMNNASKADFSEQGEFEQEDHEDDREQDDEGQTEFDKFYEEHINKHGMSL